jgi:hypothetical protein
MKRFCLSVAGLFAAITLAQADLVMVQKVEGGGRSGEETIKIKGDKSRTDFSGSVSMIADGATGEMITLSHTDRTYLKISATETKSMMEQLQKYRTGTDPVKLQPMGKQEKVGDYNCDVFTVALGSLTTTYWLAKDFPNFQSVLAQLEKFQAGTVTAMGRGLMPDIKDFPGMPIKTELSFDGKKIVTTLVSAKEDNVDPGLFNIPKDYKENTSPTLEFPPK